MIMDNHFKEDYYTCTTNWLIDDNPTRVFRLSSVDVFDDNTSIFRPMKDGVFVSEEKNHTDANGEVTIDNFMPHMRLSSNSEIEYYVMQVYEKTNNSLKLYTVTDELKKLYSKMKKVFWKKGLFINAMKEIGDFDSNDIYHDDEKMLLNLLRSYYKCRILEK